MMATGFLKRGMTYLGLSDDEYEDPGMPVREDQWGSSRTTYGPDDEEGMLPARSVQTVTPTRREHSATVSMITPRTMREAPTEMSPHVEAVTPTEFGDARQIADSVIAGQPVIVNLQSASRELTRRMIDFCSGVAYALGGGMERVANNVFLITPSGVELSAQERRRA